MTERETLQSLETLLESFLEQAVASKGHRLAILEGINRLDDIASAGSSEILAEAVGDWLADHSDWLAGQVLRPGDKRRIAQMLAEVNKSTELADKSAEASKIKAEITRWNETLVKGSGGLVLKRGAEPEQKVEDPIQKFSVALGGISDLYWHLAGSQQHLLSLLDEALKLADLQKNREALLLAGFLLYYLRISGYKIEPYVRRLKEAEGHCLEKAAHA